MRSTSPTIALAALALTGLTGVAGCAARPPRAMSGAARPTDAAATLRQAESAQRAGRTAEALALLADAGNADVDVEVRRQALYLHGLIRLDAGSPQYDIEAAAGLLSAARALYDVPPLPLHAALALVEQVSTQRQHLVAAEQARDALAGRADAAAARLRSSEDQAARLQRTVKTLTAELEQRDAALKKAAAAVMGTPRSR